jgi:oxygen-independent coproporphyrinogen-3 oxidase
MELDRAASLEISHLSCYGLTPEPGTPLGDDLRFGRITLPDEDVQADMYLSGAEYLEKHGFLQYEISNFARNGSVCTHNAATWQGKDYLGCGPAAVSTVNGRRWANPASLHGYRKVVLSGELGQSAELLTFGPRVRELVMLSLRTVRGLSCWDYMELTGQDFCLEHAQVLKELSRQKLVQAGTDRISLTRQGMAVCDAVLERFL